MRHPRTSMWTRLSVVCIACSIVPSAAAHAQAPLDAQHLARARDACNAIAVKEGYRVVRRDRERMNGASYELPFHVAHGTTETDLVCKYDDQRHVAALPAFETLHLAAARTPVGSEGVARRCESFVNARKGYQVEKVGDVTARGQRLWDVALRVRRDGRNNVPVTCRFNEASGKFSLR
jgi:hypothetical protein